MNKVCLSIIILMFCLCASAQPDPAISVFTTTEIQSITYEDGQIKVTYNTFSQIINNSENNHLIDIDVYYFSAKIHNPALFTVLSGEVESYSATRNHYIPVSQCGNNIVITTVIVSTPETGVGTPFDLGDSQDIDSIDCIPTQTPLPTNTPTPQPVPYPQPNVNAVCDGNNQILVYLTYQGVPYGDSDLNSILIQYFIDGDVYYDAKSYPFTNPVVLQGEAGAFITVKVQGVPKSNSGYSISAQGSDTDSCPNPTNTPTHTHTATPTATSTNAAPPTPTPTPTNTHTPINTNTPTNTSVPPTATDTFTPAPPPTATPTASATFTGTLTHTPTSTWTPTFTSTYTNTPTSAAPPSPTPTQQATGTPTPLIYPLIGFSAKWVVPSTSVQTAWAFNPNTLTDNLTNRVNIAFVTDDDNEYVSFTDGGLASPPIANNANLSATAQMMFFELVYEPFTSYTKLNSAIASPLQYGSTYTFVARNEEISLGFGRTTFWIKDQLVMPEPTPEPTATPQPTPQQPLTNLVLHGIDAEGNSIVLYIEEG